MEQYKLELSEQGRENIEETIATLMEAAQEIANSTEKDFEKMKSKKWYKRFWELVTYSKDNQKVTARGVANLAKLNEIVMKAIVILARYSADTATLVSESLQKIENLEDYLGQVTSSLSKVALEVKKLKYNYKKSLTLSDLNVQERDIVGSIFVKYVKKCFAEGKKPTSASQKLYSFAMEGDTPEEDIDISTHLDLLNTDVQQLLFRLNQSYYYLVAGEFDDSDYFDDFEVSNKNKKAILSQIEDAVLFSGAENYTDTLLPNEEVYFIDSDNVEFEVTDVEEANSGNVIENQNVSSMVYFDDYHLIGYITESIFACENDNCDQFTGLMYSVKHSFKVGEIVGFAVISAESITGFAKVLSIKVNRLGDIDRSVNYAEATDKYQYEVTLDFDNEKDSKYDFYNLYKLGTSNDVDYEFESTEDYIEAKKDIFDKYIYDISDLSSSVTKDISGKKITNAINSFGWVLMPDDENILGMIDTTLFGSGKEGFFFTTEGLAYKVISKIPTAIKYEEIDYIDFIKIGKNDCDSELRIHTTDDCYCDLISVSINKTPMKEFLEKMRDYKRNN